MIRSKLIFGLFLILTVSFSTRAQGSVDLTWKVVNYDISATLPQDFQKNRDLDVVAKLRIKNISAKDYSKLTLRISDQATISGITSNGSIVDFRKSQEDIGGGKNLQRALVSLPSIAPNNEAVITVKYKLNVKTNSGLNALSPVSSQFLPLSFWYPTPTSWYFSGSADHAPFKVTVNGLNGRQMVTSDGQSSNSFSSNINGMPFFVTGKWRVFDENGVIIYAPESPDPLVKKRAGELAQFLSSAKSFVEKRYGKKISVPLKIVSVARGAGFSDSGVVLIDESVFVREKLDSQTAMNLVESVAKLWLGGEIDISGDGFAVIQEGLSKHIANDFIESQYGKEVATIEKLRQRISYSAIAQRSAPLSITTPLDSYFYTSAANKGAMIWDFLEHENGERFYEILRGASSNGTLTLSKVRSAFPGQKEYLDTMLDSSDSMNLLIGLPQNVGVVTKVALRNLSSTGVDVDVEATTMKGGKLRVRSRIPANGFGEAVFSTSEKIGSVEVDPDKLYTQSDYSDDVAPRDLLGNDPILSVKRKLDKQDYAGAEADSLNVLSRYPGFDEVRIMLARSQLAQKKVTEAKSNYLSALSSRLPTAQTLGWGNLGLGEIGERFGQKTEALRYFNTAIAADGEYGVTLGAREHRRGLGIGATIDPSIIQFFSNFDSLIKAKDKVGVEAIVLSGEMTRFAASIAGQAVEWESVPNYVDVLDDENVLVETNVKVRLIDKNQEAGIGVFRLSKVGGKWFLDGSDVFEVK
ncbi:MAG: tetratricopeptide repeat protein [Pyrinomonadaceae bacterium]